MGMSALIVEGNRLFAFFQSAEKNINTAINNAKNVAVTMWRTYYVDAVNGVDDGVGTEAAPFKTLKKAIDSLTAGGGGTIRVKTDQTFTLDADISLLRKSVQVSRWGTGANPIIANVCIGAPDASGLTNGTTGFILEGSTLAFYNCRVKTANYIDNGGLPISTFRGFIKKADRPGGALVFSSTPIEIGDTPLMRQSPNGQMMDVSLYGVGVTRTGPIVPTCPLIDTGGVPLNFSVASCTKPAGTKWFDDFVIGGIRTTAGVLQSIVTNVKEPE